MRVVSLFCLVALCFAAVVCVSAQVDSGSVTHSVTNNADGSVTVTATATASQNVKPEGSAAADNDIQVGAVLGGTCSSGSRTGKCQTNTAACAGEYVSGLCPGTAANVRCCLAREVLSGSTLQERAYNKAVASLHIREVGGNNRGPEVDAIISQNQGDRGEPWCGDFMAFCYRAAGSNRVTRKWASAYGTKDSAGISKTTSPIRGDLVVFNFSHIGMFVSRASSTIINTIEGNTGPSGASRDAPGSGVHKRTRATSLVLYYLRVSS